MMDYEKAYKAVLQTATQWIKDGCNDKVRICLECVFPELRESEDERIRKELVEYLTVTRQSDFVSRPDRQRWIKYLEKQEQKPAWSEEDEKNLELVIDCIYEFYPDPVMKYKSKDWLNNLRPSWKPSEEQMEALRKAVNKLANTDVADSVRLSIMYDNLKKL